MRGGGQAPSVELFQVVVRGFDHFDRGFDTRTGDGDFLDLEAQLASVLRLVVQRHRLEHSVQDVAQLSCDVALSGGRLHAAAEQALVHLPKRRLRTFGVWSNTAIWPSTLRPSR